MSKRSVLYIFIIISIITTAILTNKAYRKNKLNFKPIIKVKIINFLPGSKEETILWRSDILKEKYKIQAAEENFDIIVDMVYDRVNIDEIDKNHKAIRIFVTPEAISPNINKYDLSLGFDHVEHDKYLRMPYYYVKRNKISTKFDRGICNPKKENFACFLVSNPGGWQHPHNPYAFDGCDARNSLFHNLSKYKKVLSGGKYLNNIGRVIPYNESQKWLSKCKFIIAYENQSYPGYITEKPFQAYSSGAIPLYYAHPTALEDINPRSVIYAGDFKTENDLIEYIKKVDSDDELYCKIWNEKMLIDPKRDFEVVNEQLRVKLNKLLDARFKK
jgi:hypothetical protein